MKPKKYQDDIESLMTYIIRIFRVVSSTGHVDMVAFEAYVKEAHTFMVKTYYFAPIPITGLRMLSHCIEKMKGRGNRGLGPISET